MHESIYVFLIPNHETYGWYFNYMSTCAPEACVSRAETSIYTQLYLCDEILHALIFSYMISWITNYIH